MKNYHEMKGAPYISPIEAATAAVAQAEEDMANGVVRWLCYGGPVAPWFGDKQDNLRALGVLVEATTACEITFYQDVYAHVYNATTVRQWIPEM